jgi:hypothetical protein
MLGIKLDAKNHYLSCFEGEGIYKVWFFFGIACIFEMVPYIVSQQLEISQSLTCLLKFRKLL